jgi:hypothetical protein
MMAPTSLTYNLNLAKSKNLLTLLEMQGKFPQKFGKNILRKHGICEGILLFNF